jgi:deazaflavin-dependent oxidoreductase (nitroreductase family)
MRGPEAPVFVAAPRFGGVFWRIARVGNRLTRPAAGRRWLALFAIVEHRGRRTGRLYRTTVAARRVPDGFIIALAFGEQVDWVRNVLAEAECVIRWRGVDHAQLDPQMIDAKTGLAAFDPVLRTLFRIAGIHAFVRLRDAAGEG